VGEPALVQLLCREGRVSVERRLVDRRRLVASAMNASC